MKQTSAKTIKERLIKLANSHSNKREFWAEEMSIRIGVLKKNPICNISRSLELVFFANEMFKKSLGETK